MSWHDLTAIRATRHQIEAQLMAGTYCTAVDDTEAHIDMKEIE